MNLFCLRCCTLCFVLVRDGVFGREVLLCAWFVAVFRRNTCFGNSVLWYKIVILY